MVALDDSKVPGYLQVTAVIAGSAQCSCTEYGGGREPGEGSKERGITKEAIQKNGGDKMSAQFSYLEWTVNLYMTHANRARVQKASRERRRTICTYFRF